MMTPDDCGMGLMKGLLVAIFGLAAVLSVTTNAHAWGAFAAGQKEFGWGMAYNYGSKNDAISKALQLCRRNGERCKLITTFRSQWAGLAVGKVDRNTSAWGFAKGKSQKKVRDEALRQCRIVGGRNCKIEFLEFDKTN